MTKKPLLIVIAGPTAVGKTSIAIEVALALDTEILSADSRQCYTGMRIGTAQPNEQERQKVQHHFIDCYPPTQSLSAADYEKIGMEICSEVFSRKPYLVVCGGTGLYIQALCEGLDPMPAIQPDIEQDCNHQYKEKGLGWLQEAVRQEDPLFYTSGEVHNPARLLRALIFVRSSGQSILHFRKKTNKERPFDILKIGLSRERTSLYQRIDQRVLQMLEEGLEEEAKALYPFKALKNLQTVGYQELFDYWDGIWDKATAISKIQQHSRNYAKRQMTWFKKDSAYHWLDASDLNCSRQILHLINTINR